jgi:hypothetical protein
MRGWEISQIRHKRVFEAHLVFQAVYSFINRNTSSSADRAPLYAISCASIALHELLVTKKFTPGVLVCDSASESCPSNKMSFPAISTPQRPLPGAYFNTPAVTRYQGGLPPRQPVFQRQTTQQTQSSNASQDVQQQAPQLRPISQSQSLQPIQRAARTINELLQRDASFPDVDSYVRRKHSSWDLKEQS